MKFSFRRYRPRLALVLLLVGLSLLSVPIGAVLYLNVIENYLLRRTETKLIARGDIVVSAYRTAFQRYYPAALGLEGYGKSPLYNPGEIARPKLWYFGLLSNSAHNVVTLFTRGHHDVKNYEVWMIFFEQ